MPLCNLLTRGKNHNAACNGMYVFYNTASGFQCSGDFSQKFWTAGQRTDPAAETAFVWKVLTPNGYEEWPMNYTNWADNQPDWSTVGESCVHTWNNYEWNDASCSDAMCYLCEYETVMPFGFIGDGYSCSGDVVIKH